MRRVIQPLVALLVAGALIVACGAETNEETADVDNRSEPDRAEPDALAMAAAVGDVDLTEDEARLVAVEAEWLCRAQRYSFSDPAEMMVARDELLAGNGVTAEQYNAFSLELANRLDLREAVLAEFAVECLMSD